MKFLKFFLLFLLMGLLSSCSSTPLNNEVVDSKTTAAIEVSDVVLDSFEVTVIEANWHGGGYHGGYTNSFESESNDIELIYFDSSNIKSSIVVNKQNVI